MSTLTNETLRRRTFAIISHPDVGKTTLTENFCCLAGDPARGRSEGARPAAAGALGLDWMVVDRDLSVSWR